MSIRTSFKCATSGMLTNHCFLPLLRSSINGSCASRLRANHRSPAPPASSSVATTVSLQAWLAQVHERTFTSCCRRNGSMHTTVHVAGVVVICASCATGVPHLHIVGLSSIGSTSTHVTGDGAVFE